MKIPQVFSESVLYLVPKKGDIVMSINERLWPDVDDEKQAKAAARYGFYACVGIIVVSIAMSFLGNVEWSAWILEGMLFAVIGFFIYRFSRVAAICGLILYVGERIILLVEQGAKMPSGLTLYLMIVFTFAFINSIRGTFAYRRFLKRQPISKVAVETKTQEQDI
jgi:hypothetical protein